jgi:hypothetical protein
MNSKTVKVLCQGDTDSFASVLRTWLARHSFRDVRVDGQKGEAVCEVPLAQASELHKHLAGSHAPRRLISAVFPKSSLPKRQFQARNSIVLGPAVARQRQLIRGLPSLSSTPAKAMRLLDRWGILRGKRAAV